MAKRKVVKEGESVVPAVAPPSIGKADTKGNCWDLSGLVRKQCNCPKCGGKDMDKVGEEELSHPKEGPYIASKMKCRADGAIFYCKDTTDKPQDCACPVCGAKPGRGLAPIGPPEERPNGKLTHYKCDKGHLPPAPCQSHPAECAVHCVTPPGQDKCMCPKCGNEDPKEREEIPGSRQPMPDGKSFIVRFKCKKCGEEFECMVKDGGGECKCPTCGKFNADELPPRQKLMDGPEGEVWLVKYKCKDDGTEFERQKQECKGCKCPGCGSKDKEEVSGGRTPNADGTATVRYHCKACGMEYSCIEGKPTGCKCPDCATPVDETTGEFEVLEETKTADGETVVRYLHKPDGAEFTCKKKEEKMDPCRCPLCKGHNFAEVKRRTVMKQIVVTFKCMDCDPQGLHPFDCIESEKCFCKDCASNEFLEEVKREKLSGGDMVHYKCTKGHLARDSPCSLGRSDCVVCCIEAKPGPGPGGAACKCPNCKATSSTRPLGLRSLGPPTENIFPSPDGPVKVRINHYACDKCGYVRGECSTGQYTLTEAVECITPQPKLPKCPTCKSTNVSIEKTETIKKDGKTIFRKHWVCNDCAAKGVGK